MAEEKQSKIKNIVITLKNNLQEKGSKKHLIYILLLVGIIGIIYAAVTTITGIFASATSTWRSHFEFYKASNPAVRSITESLGNIMLSIQRSINSLKCAFTPFSPECVETFQYVEASEYSEAQKERYGVYAYSPSSKTTFTFSMSTDDEEFTYGEPIIVPWEVEINFPRFGNFIYYPTVYFYAWLEDTNNLFTSGNYINGDLATALREVGQDPNACISVDRDSFSTWKGSTIVNVIIPYECLKNLADLKQKKGLIPKSFYAYIHFGVEYESSEVTDYYILVVKPSIVQLANLKDQSVWDYLKVPMEKYVASRWLGLPGYYVALGIGSKEPVPLLSDAKAFTVYFVIRTNDPDVKIKEIDEFKLCIPEYLELENKEGTLLSFSATPSSEESFGKWKLLCYNLKKENLERLTKLVKLYEDRELNSEVGGAIRFRIKDEYKDELLKYTNYFDIYLKVYFKYKAKKDYKKSVAYENTAAPTE